MIRLEFHGAAQTVTGSKYLVRSGQDALLIDCGMFQGLKELRLRNWEHPDFDVADLEHIVLTHAHTDHAAFLPRLHKLGFRGKVLSKSIQAENPACKAIDFRLHLDESGPANLRRYFRAHNKGLEAPQAVREPPSLEEKIP